jgi:hypothetical protein
VRHVTELPIGNVPSNGRPKTGNTAFAEAGCGAQAADADDGAVGPDVQPKATVPANPSSLTRQIMALQTLEAT